MQSLYDPDGNPSASLRAGLVKKIKPDGTKTLYVAGIYEVSKNSGGTVTGTVTYYPEAGAMRNSSGLYFVLKDHLGSASAVTDSTGTTVGEDRFYPFGETRFTTGNMQADKTKLEISSSDVRKSKFLFIRSPLPIQWNPLITASMWYFVNCRLRCYIYPY